MSRAGAKANRARRESTLNERDDAVFVSIPSDYYWISEWQWRYLNQFDGDLHNPQEFMEWLRREGYCESLSDAKVAALIVLMGTSNADALLAELGLEPWSPQMDDLL